MARGVVCIFLNGNRKAYTSVAETARELQISKDGVRKACERRCQLRGVWFKYSGDRDAATSPAPSEKAHWNVVVVPDDEVARIYCKQFGITPVTTVRICNGALDCTQFCSASGTTFREAIGEDMHAKLVRSLADRDVTEDEMGEGLHMAPVEASKFADEHLDPQVAHFIKCLVVFYVSGTFNRLLLEMVQASSAMTPLPMRIPTVPAHMQLITVKKDRDD
ncbi:hypothetical protein WJX74_010938 [Apatococcus lobatus]|uniref:Uncharacterized protein n=1 Tax=Apatococcus lobatus TaxID=904363 RepID=A0AAW1Q4L4_9CHLO